MKPYYYTFEWKDRVITLCIIHEEPVKITTDTLFKWYTSYNKERFPGLYMGYSVKLPQDQNNEDFAKSIAMGRANKHKTAYYIGTIKPILFKDKGILKAIARNCERNIKDGIIVIKGIR